MSLFRRTSAVALVASITGAVCVGCANPAPADDVKGDGATDVSAWRATSDGFISTNSTGTYRQITRCWTLMHGAVDCVWIGGTDDPSEHSASFTVERRGFVSMPSDPGPFIAPTDGKAYYSCGMAFSNYGGLNLDAVSEELTVSGSRVLSNSRSINGLVPGEPWSGDDLLRYLERTNVEVGSPMIDCEQLGTIIQKGSFEALSTSHWTSPDTSAASGLPSL